MSIEAGVDVLSHRARDLEVLAQLCPIDDDFMRMIFRDQLALAQHVLQVLLDDTSIALETVETQRDAKRLVGARSASFDVWCRDSSGSAYDLEVERGGSHLARRARYYLGAADAELLDEGQGFGDLPDVHVVFVYEHDWRRLGGGRYHVDRHCVEYDTPFDDGEHIMIISAKYRGDDELGILMRDFCESDPDKMGDALLAERVAYLKRDPRGVHEMCELMEAIRQEGIEQGMQQGMRL